MKKFVMLLCLGLLLTGCGEKHEHHYETWERDGEKHWMLCDCGEGSEPTAHALDEDGCCQVCGALIRNDEDDCYSIMLYDEQGNICLQTDYDAAGNVVFEMRCETVYDQQGNPKDQKIYYNGVLESECVYLPTTNNDAADVYVSEEILYAGDCKYISKFDEFWRLLSYTTQDLEGNVLSEDVYELEFDDQGNVVKTTCYTDGEISNVSQDMLGPDGTMYNVSNIYYENGQVVYFVANQYEFDANGQLILQREYTDDILNHEIQYHGNIDDGYYLAYEASYDDTGALLWEYRYDTEGNIIEG